MTEEICSDINIKHTNIMNTKAFNLLDGAKSVSARASQYASRIKKSIELKIINALEEEIGALNDKIFDLEDFSLETDKNRGVEKITKEAAEQRFTDIINIKFEIDMKKAELKSKKKSFNELFVTRA